MYNAYEKSLVFAFGSPKSGKFLKKITMELVLKSFSGRNNSAEVPRFVFPNSLPYDLEESREFKALISSVWG